ncbi:MAG: DUF6391 domain-containing protein [Bacillota bacterium]
MWFLFFALLLSILFPPLLLPLSLVMILVLLFIPFKFTIDSLLTLLVAPQQIIKIATNFALRRNHALEHATINVLEESYTGQQLSGLAKENGFIIYGNLDPAIVKQAAKQGLTRLQNGEQELVVHDRCGSSLIVGNILAAIIFLALLLQTGNLTIIYVLVALLLSRLLRPIVGRYVQLLFTTSAEVEGIVIKGIRYNHSVDHLLGFRLSAEPQELFVETEKLEVY